MTTRVITRDQLDQLLERLLGEGLRLVAPIHRGVRLMLDVVTSAVEIEHECTSLDGSAKELLFPRTEAVLHYRRDGDRLQLTDVAPEVIPTVLFGVRPCDAAAFAILREVFACEPRDSFFLQRLDATTVIAVACREPQPQCFCTAVGYGPGASDGSDLLLTELAEGYAVESSSDRGRQLVEHHHDLFAVDPAAKQAAATAVQAAKAQLTRTESLSGAGTSLGQAFDSEHWQRLGLSCLGCGACAFSCPTCHCFDLIDRGDTEQGERLKIWDCCGFKTFTVHASGHNPRPSQPTRFRQRIMHKLSYFPERFGRAMCVGCGRCLLACPVGQDIYHAALAVTEATTQSPVNEE